MEGLRVGHIALVGLSGLKSWFNVSHSMCERDFSRFIHCLLRMRCQRIFDVASFLRDNDLEPISKEQMTNARHSGHKHSYRSRMLPKHHANRPRAAPRKRSTAESDALTEPL